MNRIHKRTPTVRTVLDSVKAIHPRAVHSEFRRHRAGIHLIYRRDHRAHAIGEALIIGGIVVGIIGTFQPWTIAAYQIGFHLLLLCMLAFNVWSHVIPHRERRGEAH